MTTVAALFDTRDQAEAAVRRLVEVGLPRDEIGVVGASEPEMADPNATPGVDDTRAAAGVGAVMGGGLGLLVGLGLMVIPGIGPILAAGPLSAALGGALAGAGVGAATGGVLVGLSTLGISEDDSYAYSEAVRRGGTLVTVRAPEGRDVEAADIMEEAGAVDVDARAESWRASGWTGFDGTTGATSRTEIEGGAPRPASSGDAGPIGAAASMAGVATAANTQPVRRRVRVYDAPPV